LGQGPLVDLCLFLEAMGAVVAPGPLFATTVLWAGLGEGTGTVAFVDDPTMPYVLDVDSVEHVAFATAEGVFLADDAPLDVALVESIDWTRRLFSVRHESRFGYRRSGDVDALRERAWVALSAEVLGTTRWLLESTIAYATEP